MPEIPDFESLEAACAARAQRLEELDRLLAAEQLKIHALLDRLKAWDDERNRRRPPDA